MAPDKRRYRGAHPKDWELFADPKVEVLRRASVEYAWLLEHHYSPDASLKLVGDHHGLAARQRAALQRCTCSRSRAIARSSLRVPVERAARRNVWIDGFNVLVTVEAALSSGPVFVAKDGALRDMASMHGTYRSVATTIPAVRAIGQVVLSAQPQEVVWLLDAPVSNSGRLRALIESIGHEQGWSWRCELSADPDRELLQPQVAGGLVATADSGVLDRLLSLPVDRRPSWLNLARLVVDSKVPDAWVIDLG
jgi:hypothetical protein